MISQNSLSKFQGILFTPIQWIAVACYAAGPLKVRLSFSSQNVPFHLQNPTRTPIYIYIYIYMCVCVYIYIFRHRVTALFPSWLMRCWHACFDYRLQCSSLWVVISTLAYETNCNCWPERLSVTYCTHIIQTKLMLKNQRYPPKSKFTATGGPTHMPLVLLG